MGKIRHGSLFSGIGGFDLAAEWMGWENVFHCEWNEFGQRILKYYWPKAITYGDITKTDFSVHRGKIDILTGGFPCQPYSQAGKRLGKEDDRHLWPEMLRAIREIEPKWIVGENVRGLVNWNGGLVFNEVQVDLENEGYEVIPFILPACAKNAPHRRDRVWFIATNPKGWGLERQRELKSPERFKGKQRTICDNEGVSVNSCSNTDSFGQAERPKKHEPNRERQFGEFGNKNDWKNWPTQPPICSGDDGVSIQLDGITVSKWKTESIKGYGNAIVPQVALEIFKAIKMAALADNARGAFSN